MQNLHLNSIKQVMAKNYTYMQDKGGVETRVIVACIHQAWNPTFIINIIK